MPDDRRAHKAGADRPARDILTEDYLVYVVNELDGTDTAEQLLAERGDQIAVMLRGERQKLSDQEKTTILRHRISYLVDDLVIPTWNAAFVYDTPTGAQAALEIVEFANSQLLEYRYYDQRLDDELASIYARLQQPGWFDQWRGSRYTRAARQVHSLFIEVNEVTDRTENALKFIGDIYAARLFWLVAERWVWARGRRTSRPSSRRSTTSTGSRSSRPRCRAASSSS